VRFLIIYIQGIRDYPDQPLCAGRVEDVRLSRKVLYHFAIFIIINEILIFEDCRKEACSVHRQMQALGEIRPSLSARGVVYCFSSKKTMATLVRSERSHCRSKQFRARQSM